MCPISAKGGSFSYRKTFGAAAYTAVPDVTSVTITTTSQVQEYGSSSTNGWKNRVAGHSDSSLSVTILAQAGSMDLGFERGELLQAKAVSTSGKEFTGYFRVASIASGIPIGDGGLVSIDVELAQTVEPPT